MTQQWCIPPKTRTDFVCPMEDLLEVYQRPFSEEKPQVRVDEVSLQLIGEVQEPLPVKPGHPRREDYEYKRDGTRNMFVMVAPKLAWRYVKVTERRTNQDWAHCIKDLLDINFTKAKKMVLVTDNLNTHKEALLYEAFAPEEAKRLLDKIEWHYTPKHGSRLDMAENEISVLRGQVLSRRIPDAKTLEAKISAWQEDRNQRKVKIHWTFIIEIA